MEEVVKEILLECKRLTIEPVRKAELEKVKEYLVGNMKLELESSDAWASYFGGQEVVNKKIQTPEEIEFKIRAVTSAQLQKAAQTFFADAGLNLALIGPFQKSVRFAKMLKVS